MHTVSETETATRDDFAELLEFMEQVTPRSEDGPGGEGVAENAARDATHSGVPWRRIGAVAFVGLGMLAGLELAASGRVGFDGVQPSPYWIVVLGMALWGGAAAGVLGACAAGLLHVIGAVAFGGAHPLSLPALREPLLFVAVGWIVGAVTWHRARAGRRFERQRARLLERCTTLQRERDRLARRGHRLERRITEQLSQLRKFMDAAIRMETGDRHELFDVALEMVEEHCGAAASVFKVTADGGLELAATRGLGDDVLGEHVDAARRSALVRRAVDEGCMTSMQLQRPVRVGAAPLAVAPLQHPSGSVAAVLCLHCHPEPALTPAMLATFAGIAEWVTASYLRLSRGVAPLDPAMATHLPARSEPVLGCAEDLEERLLWERERARRQGLPTALIAIQAEEFADPTPLAQAELDDYCRKHLSRGLRPSDRLYRFGYPGCYVLVLAGTRPQGAEIVRRRILAATETEEGCKRKPFGNIVARSLAIDSTTADLGHVVQKLAAYFRERSAFRLPQECPVRVAPPRRLGDRAGLEDRIAIETSIGIRHGVELHVLDVQAVTRPKGEEESLGRHVLQVAGSVLRDGDGLYQIDEGRVAVVLPGCDANSAFEVAGRLEDLLALTSYGEVRTRVFSLGTTSHSSAAMLLDALAR